MWEGGRSGCSLRESLRQTAGGAAGGGLQLHTELFLCKISPSLEAVPLSGWVRGRVGEATEGRGRGSAVVERVSAGWGFRPLRLSMCRVSVKFPTRVSMQWVDNTPSAYKSL